MTQSIPALLADAVGSLSSVSLASVLDQSVDCVKVVGLAGDLQYMNGNGLCAMEIDDFCAVQGQQWSALWPDEAKRAIEASYATAAQGETVRFRAFCPTAKATRGGGTSPFRWFQTRRVVMPDICPCRAT